MLGNPTDRAVLRKAFTALDCTWAGSWIESDAASSAVAGAESGVDSGDDVAVRAGTADHPKIDPIQINPRKEWRIGGLPDRHHRSLHWKLSISLARRNGWNAEHKKAPRTNAHSNVVQSAIRVPQLVCLLLANHQPLILRLPLFFARTRVTVSKVTMARTLFVVVFCFIGVTLRAQNVQPSISPSASPSPSPSPLNAPSPTPTPQIPRDLIPNPNSVPVPTPPPSAPDLLPESNKLPPTPTPGPNPADLIPYGIPIGPPTPAPKPLVEQAVKDQARFREILTIAKRDPHAIEIWANAAKVDNLEYKRGWLRQYDNYVSGVMRKLEPRLKATIDAWERGQLSVHNQHNIKPTIPLLDLQSSRR